MHRNRLAGRFIAWAVMAGAGMWPMARFEFTPGPSQAAPQRRPLDSSFSPAKDRTTPAGHAQAAGRDSEPVQRAKSIFGFAAAYGKDGEARFAGGITAGAALMGESWNVRGREAAIQESMAELSPWPVRGCSTTGKIEIGELAKALALEAINAGSDAWRTGTSQALERKGRA